MRNIACYRYGENGEICQGGKMHQRREPSTAEEAADGSGAKRSVVSALVWIREQVGC